jgi:hypothetical protein
MGHLAAWIGQEELTCPETGFAATTASRIAPLSELAENVTFQALRKLCSAGDQNVSLYLGRVAMIWDGRVFCRRHHRRF